MHANEYNKMFIIHTRVESSVFPRKVQSNSLFQCKVTSRWFIIVGASQSDHCIADVISWHTTMDNRSCHRLLFRNETSRW